MNPNSKQIKKKFLCVCGGGGGWGRISDFFCTKDLNLKRKNSFFFWQVGGGEVQWGCGGVDGRTDEQAQTHLPLQLL